MFLKKMSEHISQIKNIQGKAKVFKVSKRCFLCFHNSVFTLVNLLVQVETNH